MNIKPNTIPCPGCGFGISYSRTFYVHTTGHHWGICPCCDQNFDVTNEQMTELLKGEYNHEDN